MVLKALPDEEPLRGWSSDFGRGPTIRSGRCGGLWSRPGIVFQHVSARLPCGNSALFRRALIMIGVRPSAGSALPVPGEKAMATSDVLRSRPKRRWGA